MTRPLVYTREVPLESIFESIKEQIQQLGPDTNWKIYVAPLSREEAGEEREKASGSNSNPTPYPWGKESISEFFKYHLNLEEQLSQSYQTISQCEKQISRQSNKLHKAEMESVRTHLAMKNIYIIKHDEEKLHHLNQIRSHELRIEQLNQNLKNLLAVVKSLDQVQLSPNDLELSRDKLLKDRLCLLKKLKVTELRLEMRDVELQAIRHNGHGKYGSIKRPSSMHHIAPNRCMMDKSVLKKVPLLSLGSLADSLLKSSQPQNEVKRSHVRTFEPQETRVHEKRRVIEDNKRPKAIKLTYKDQWTAIEDDALFKKVDSYGENEWEKVSKALPYRSSAECYRRYHQLTS
ncbi:uncharacterized protein EV154DRAFT_519164 [Mucor mucedo]|uniref:uncharacterized protein n=1 Tax=Mucor mucedo TaxID=29922 RepID=UPI00221ED655|nr:uncharacterized protein EV154DRAFT_519164 [Mucor mucedo]KAI7887968.1 hypothetical protein EV154DRAFT_519164 [Mucor mucedo]